MINVHIQGVGNPRSNPHVSLLKLKKTANNNNKKKTKNNTKRELVFVKRTFKLTLRAQ